MREYESARLRKIADYQFGSGAGEALFPDFDEITVRRSSSGRIRQLHIEDLHLVSVGTDGRLTLGLAGGRRLLDGLSEPTARVVVGDESAPFIREGRSAFAKFVRAVDPAVRARDEVAVVHHDGTLLGVGRAELDAESMKAFDRGVAVRLRAGVDPEG